MLLLIGPYLLLRFGFLGEAGKWTNCIKVILWQFKTLHNEVSQEFVGPQDMIGIVATAN